MTSQAAIRDLIRRVNEKTPLSKALAGERHSALAAPALLSRLSFEMKEAVYPLTVERASGARAVDVDGNEYVDLLMGFGVGLFGHNPPFLVEALREQLDRGVQIGLHDRHSGEVAALIRQLTGMERTVFFSSGTEAVMTAIRLARAATGRDRVAFFANSYHGHSEATLFRPGGAEGMAIPRALGIPATMAETALVLEYGNDSALEILERVGSTVAAVLVEPVQRANVGLQPREFLHALRAVTQRTGTQLVFDEVLTGFRLHPAGAQGWFGVTADLATYGKVLGGGMPIGAVSGRAGLLDFVDGGAWSFGDDSGPRSFTTFVAGTFSKHPLAMAAALAVLRRFVAEGTSICDALAARTTAFVAALNADLQEHRIPLRAVSCGSMFGLEPTDGAPFAAGPGSPADLLHYHLLLRAVFASSQGPTYVLSTAHGDEELAIARRAFIDSLLEIRDGDAGRPTGVG